MTKNKKALILLILGCLVIGIGVLLLLNNNRTESVENDLYKEEDNTGDDEDYGEEPYNIIVSNPKSGEKIEVPIKKNYVFKGYYTEPNGMGDKVVESDGTVLIANLDDDNTLLYPVWEEVISGEDTPSDEPVISPDDLAPSNNPAVPTPTPSSNPGRTDEPGPSQVITNLLEIRFLNTSRLSGMTSNQSESIIIKAKSDGKVDDKIIVIDLARNNGIAYNVFKNNLASITNNKNKIDMLILSHSHTDHTGGLKILNDENKITVDTLLYKNEKYSNSFTTEQINRLNSKSKVAVNNMGEYKEYVINSKVKLTLFNLQDVFADKSCEASYNAVNFTKDVTKNAPWIKYNNQYVYVNGVNDVNTNGTSNYKLFLTDTLTKDNNRFYAYYEEETSLCNANANSIAVLITVSTDSGDKYIYIPSDLENNGYSVFGEYSSSANAVIYGTGTSHIFKSNYNNNDNNAD